ncbi:MAG: nuclear transport factor 2 family protein [Anaeromyxobacteraceae bacterium]
MSRLVALTLAFSLSLPASAAAGPAEPPRPSRRVSTPEDLAAIREVLDGFMAAIRTKDGKALSALVLNDRILFNSPGDQARVDAIRQHDTHFDGLGAPGFREFAEFVASAKAPIEERFSNVQITQDAHLAWALFDYEFLEGGKVQNFGVEAWQLRKTDGKWKIFSVVWSQHAP